MRETLGQAHERCPVCGKFPVVEKSGSVWIADCKCGCTAFEASTRRDAVRKWNRNAVKLETELVK